MEIRKEHHRHIPSAGQIAEKRLSDLMEELSRWFENPRTSIDEAGVLPRRLNADGYTGEEAELLASR